MSKARPEYRTSASTSVISGAGALPEFITKQIAAGLLGLSVRRVLELANTGQIKRRQVLDPVTKRKQTVLSVRDVHRIIEGNRRLLAYRGSTVGAGEVAALLPVQPPPQAPAPPSERPWLTVEEAAAYSGLPASFLLGLVEKRRLPALDVGVRQGGRYRVARRDIDAIKASHRR